MASPKLRPMRPDFTGLVSLARGGDAEAWASLVGELKGLVWSVLADFHLPADDRKDVFAAVFCRLVERLDTIREPDKLPGWMATTTRNEARTLLKARGRLDLRDELDDGDAGVRPLDERLLDDELRVALRAGFGRLGDACQELLRLVTLEPPMSYDEIAVLLGIPRGSIGPTRQRCLDRLRRTPEVRAFLDAPKAEAPAGRLRAPARA